MYLCPVHCHKYNYEESKAPPVSMTWLFYTAWLVSKDHIFHVSEILQNIGNFGPVPSNTWPVDITAHPFLEMLKLHFGKIRFKWKSLFPVSCFYHIENDNFCETVLDTYILGHSNFSGMCD